MHNTSIDVLDKGFVRLDGHMADDLSVVNAARVSFATRKDLMDESDVGLVRFLMREHHGTPFEHNAFRFHVKAPIFIAREWFRHRIGSFNEWSGRYSKLEGEFYVPEPENVRSQIGKPGAYTFEPVSDSISALVRNRDLHEAYWKSWSSYEAMLDNGVAKEIARLVLPVGIYTQFYWTVNARSLMNFLSLRNAPTAMWEIQQYAKVIEDIFAELMPVTAEAFVRNERVAP
nr:thymidylate synthase, flavin-dependent [uncultured bacterium]